MDPWPLAGTVSSVLLIVAAAIGPPDGCGMHASFVRGEARGPTARGPVPTAVTTWEVRVVDATTGIGVPGMQVEVRSPALADEGHVIEQVTDAEGRATLQHAPGFADLERVIALGDSRYHYTSREERPGIGVTTLYVMPYVDFWKSAPIAAATGTTTPIVWNGQCDGPAGPIPFTVEIDVPPGVLPQDCQIWLAARPAHQAVNNAFPLDEAPAHFGQLHLELRSADGSEVLTDELRAPGVRIAATPWWWPGSYWPIDDNVVVRRLNKVTLAWDTTAPKGTFQAATGKASFSVRSFSCIDISAERYGNALRGNPGQQTQPPTPAPLPVETLPTIHWEDCLRILDPSVWVPVVCCVYQSTGVKTITKGSTFTATESTVSDLQSGFNLSLVGLDKLIGKLNIASQSKVSRTTTQTFESTVQESDSKTVEQGTTLTNCACMTGTARLCGLTRKATLRKAGCPDAAFYVYKGLGIAYCLQYVECAPGCTAPGPHAPRVESAPGQPICDNAWPECKE